MKKNPLQKLFDLLETMKTGNGELPVQERSNLAEWLESRLHLSLTTLADEMFGSGNVTRDERKVLSTAIGAALDVYHQTLMDNAPQLFQRRPWDDAPDDAAAGTVSEGGAQTASDEEQELMESATGGMYMPLVEKAVRKDGTIPVKIIQPGWGSSGYYPAEVLERDGPKIFTKGTKMYWNHQTPSEEAERPEGDLNHLAAELVSDARYQSNGPAGAGLYADAKVFENYKAPVDDLAGHIGVSIRAYGKATYGAMDGREGAIIQELTKGRSIDFVTAPGAGGQVLQLFEAARGADKKPTSVSVEPNSVKETSTMDEKELQSLKESVTTLQTNLGAVQDENARLKESLALREAARLLSETLVKIELPDATKTRLAESLPKRAPMKDGVLDAEAFAKLIDEAVKEEAAYLAKVGGAGSIRGLGEAFNGDETPDVSETLQGAFAALGLSESAAKIASGGRS